MRLALAAAAALLSGCVSDLLSPPATTVLAFTCAVLDPAGSRVALASLGPGDPAAVAALRDEVALLSGRPASDLAVRAGRLPQAPPGGWSPGAVAAWGRDEPFRDGDTVTLRILWVPSLGGNATGAAGPGAVAVALDAVAAVAERNARPAAEAARILLLHHAGHALGVVNRGIPVQDPTIEEREGPAGHEPDPASVLAAGWEDVRTAAWAPGATYGHYPDGAMRDWAAARSPGGVCA